MSRSCFGFVTVVTAVSQRCFGEVSVMSRCCFGIVGDVFAKSVSAVQCCIMPLHIPACIWLKATGQEATKW